MIPKRIHYCWFGGKALSSKAQQCIKSWKKYCPDYEIIEWNENNYDVHQNAYTSYTYDNGKFAFLSDYARLQIIYQYGGIYLDTDVELIKPLDELRENRAYLGFETDEYVNTGIGFGAEAFHPVIAALIKEYDQLLDGTHGVIGCPILNTRALLKRGLKPDGQKQNIDGAVIYPVDYFNPYDDPTGRLVVTENTYSIHWYAKTWMDKSKVIRSYITRPLHRLFGKDVFHKSR